MIGDSAVDVAAARAAGMRVIGILSNIAGSSCGRTRLGSGRNVSALFRPSTVFKRTHSGLTPAVTNHRILDQYLVKKNLELGGSKNFEMEETHPIITMYFTTSTTRCKILL